MCYQVFDTTFIHRSTSWWPSDSLGLIDDWWNKMLWGCLPIHLGHLEGTCNPIDCVLIDSSPGFKMFEVNGLESLNVLCCANRINYESLGPKYHGTYLGQPFFFSKKKANEDKLESQMCPGSPGCPQWVAFTVPNLHKVAGFPWCEACRSKTMAGQLALSNCI